jgi:flagellar motor switch/type III secretory pathway protein FliN
MMELKGFKVNEDIAELINQAKAIARTQTTTPSESEEDITRLEKVARLLEIGSSKLNEAMSSNNGKRKELLEQAFYAYVDIVPYLGKMPYLTIPTLQQIKNIEKLMELEMEKSVNVGDTNINVDEVMKVARESLL